jgi:hypothetical protein
MVDAVMIVGAMVHISHDSFREVFENITSALSENGSLLLTLKEGEGSRKDSDGRIFYLWQDDEARELFESLGFKVCDFSKSVSKTGSGEIWMGYVLENQ